MSQLRATISVSEHIPHAHIDWWEADRCGINVHQGGIGIAANCPPTHVLGRSEPATAWMHMTYYGVGGTWETLKVPLTDEAALAIMEALRPLQQEGKFELVEIR